MNIFIREIEKIDTDKHVSFSTIHLLEKPFHQCYEAKIRILVAGMENSNDM